MDINLTLIGQMITFFLLVLFTMKYVWPPITSAIHEREKKIAAGLEAAERAKRDLDIAEHKALGFIREAKLEAAHIVELANKRAVQLIEEAKENARQEGKHILAHAQEEIAREVSQAKEILRNQLAGLAVAGAERILNRQVDSKAHRELLDQLVAEI